MRAQCFISLGLALQLLAQVDATRAQDAIGAAADVVSYVDVSKPAVTKVADILRQMTSESPSVRCCKIRRSSTRLSTKSIRHRRGLEEPAGPH
jgi:hypothetical protein